MVMHEETNLRIVNVIYYPIKQYFPRIIKKSICYHCHVKSHSNLG